MEKNFDFELSLVSTVDRVTAMYNPCDLQIIVKSHKELIKEASYDLYLYDYTCTLMGHTTCGISNRRHGLEKDTFLVTMPIKRAWVDGDYTLYLDDGESLMKQEFSLKNTGGMEEDMKIYLNDEAKDDEKLGRAELLRCIIDTARDYFMDFSKSAEDSLRSNLWLAYQRGNLRDWTEKDVKKYISDTVAARFMKRLEKGVTPEQKDMDIRDIACLIEDDLELEVFNPNVNPNPNEDDPSPTLPREGEGSSCDDGEDDDESFDHMLQEFIDGTGVFDLNDNGTDNLSPNDNANPNLNDDEDDEDDLNPFKEPKVKFMVLPPLENPREEMEKLVGCEDVKQRIEQLTTMSKYNWLMEKKNPEGKRHTVSLHSLFLGRPGTGKTTVCKIMGGLLRKAGALSIGHVVVCTRKDFIGKNWGHEEMVVKQAVEKAQGGVLMIDEAYLLCSEHPQDPGRLVIPLLMDVLADEKQRDIAIVLCGYKDEMQRLIDLNPGLTSRFPNAFEFKDFTIDELLEITQRRVKEYGYQFTRAAWRKYRSVIEAAYQVRDPKTWGNARFVANLLENIYMHHAMRCMKHKDSMDCEHLLQITSADVQAISVSKPKPRIGF